MSTFNPKKKERNFIPAKKSHKLKASLYARYFPLRKELYPHFYVRECNSWVINCYVISAVRRTKMVIAKESEKSGRKAQNWRGMWYIYRSLPLSLLLLYSVYEIANSCEICLRMKLHVYSIESFKKLRPRNASWEKYKKNDRNQ